MGASAVLDRPRRLSCGSQTSVTGSFATRRLQPRSAFQARIHPKNDLISMRSTVRHLGIEVDDALAIAEQVDV